MPFATRHRDDPAPVPGAFPGLEICREYDPHVMGILQGRPAAEMRRRFDAGHRAYLARIGRDVAAWGWVATRTAMIGELGLRFQVPRNERYLWNFVTRPMHRGRGIYPRLMARIVALEAREAERFWIIHAPENHASAAGIRKAGFSRGGTLSFDRHNRPAAATVSAGAASFVRTIGVPASVGPVSPCWRCARSGRPWIMFCPPGTCACDYQREGVGCDHDRVAASDPKEEGTEHRKETEQCSSQDQGTYDRRQP